MAPTDPGPYNLPRLPINGALTFGVELEFLIAAIPLEYPDKKPSKYKSFKPATNPFPNDPRQVSDSRLDTEYTSYSTCIADGLKKIGVRASPFYHFPPWTSDDVAEKMGVRQTWEVKRDSSLYTRIPPTDPLSFYEWRSVELASPVFYTVEAAYSEIRKVCECLNNTYRVMLNSACGLHIHIGNGYLGFPLRTHKRLMASLWAWEPQIHILHPALRTMPIFTFGKSLRHNGTHPLHALHRPPNTTFKDPAAPTNYEAVQQIYKCQTKEDLIY